MSPAPKNSFATKSTLKSGADSFEIYHLAELEKAGVGNVTRLPFSLKVLLENLLRHEDGRFVLAEDIRALAGWDPTSAGGASEKEISFMPARVLLQDFTGVPAVVDLAAMRDAMRTLGGDPKKINPLLPAELVIDHSVQVDQFGTANAFAFNADLEMQRNIERYAISALGPKRIREFQSGAAGYRHLPPSEFGISGARGVQREERWSVDGVSRFAGRDRIRTRPW